MLGIDCCSHGQKYKKKKLKQQNTSDSTANLMNFNVFFLQYQIMIIYHLPLNMDKVGNTQKWQQQSTCDSNTTNLIYSNKFNRPGVAGAVLQSPPWLINLLIHSLTHSVMVCGNIFKVLSIQNYKSWGAEILRECSRPTTVSQLLVMPNY